MGINFSIMKKSTKQINDQLKALYENREQGYLEEDDKRILRYERVSILNQQNFLQFESLEQAKEIFDKCWGEDRSEKLYQQLAKQYGVSKGGIIDLVRGTRDKDGNLTTHVLCPVDIDTLKQMKKDHETKYANIYRIKTTGVELLPVYDEIFYSGKSNANINGWRKHFPPSFIFHCRFRLPNPTPESIREYCDSQGKPRPRNDLRVYKSILHGNPEPATDWYTWMQDTNSVEVEFRNLPDALEWINKYIGEDYYTSIGHVKECFYKKLGWRTFTSQTRIPTAGWIFEQTDYKGNPLATLK